MSNAILRMQFGEEPHRVYTKEKTPYNFKTGVNGEMTA
jgi:hypothetical protein